MNIMSVHYNYAVINNNKVIDVLIAETKEIAESLTNKICIGYTPNGHYLPKPGWEYINGELYPPKEHPSLKKWNAELFVWEPEVEKPNSGKYIWNVDTESWDAVEADPGTLI